MNSSVPGSTRRARKRAAVIGSGFGGLAAAIRLAHLGFETTLFEARDKPGGRAYVYEQDGFKFDAGPTVITAPHCLEELFELSGRKLADYVTLLPVKPFYRLLWSDGASLDYSGDMSEMREQIAARNPADVAGYERFAEYAERVFNKGYEELAATPFLHFADMLRVAPHLAWLRADRSVYKTVARFIADPHLREALSFHSLLVGGNPFETSSIYTLIHYLERKWGVWFPQGGTGALVQGLVRLFIELGGELKLNTPIAKVELEQHASGFVHRVVAENGEQRCFDLVVSNADVHHTYQHLYGALPAAQKMADRLSHADWSMSLFVLHFGTNQRYDLAHHTVIFGPRYEALLAEIFHGSELPADFSLYLHAPTVTDPTLAPPGCGAHYVLSPVPHLGNAPLDWAALAPSYAQRILTALERVMPNLRSHVVSQRWFTPQDFQTTLRSYHGSAFSVAPKLTQSAYFRPHNRDAQIPGLYIVGAGTHPGAGLPGVVNSAKATVQIIQQDFASEHAA